MIVVTYARMQPVTIGHALLVAKMESLGCEDNRIYLSSSCDSKSNPIDFETRLQWAKKAFDGVNTFVSPIPQKNFFDMLKFVNQVEKGIITVVVGSDRFDEISKRVHMYNGDLYNFSIIRVVNAGLRTDSDDVSGMSASKLREAAKLNDYETFESGLPNKLRSMSSDIFQRVREACLSTSLVSS